MLWLERVQYIELKKHCTRFVPLHATRETISIRTQVQYASTHVCT